MAAGLPPAQSCRTSGSGVGVGTIPEFGDFPLKWWGVTVHYNLVNSGGLALLIREGGEISGPIRVLLISFSLKLSTMVSFHLSVYSYICLPHPPSPFDLLSSFISQLV